MPSRVLAANTIENSTSLLLLGTSSATKTVLELGFSMPPDKSPAAFLALAVLTGSNLNHRMRNMWYHMQGLGLMYSKLVKLGDIQAMKPLLSYKIDRSGSWMKQLGDSRLTSRCQVTIPRSVRRQMKLTTGDLVVFVTRRNEIL